MIKRIVVAITLLGLAPGVLQAQQPSEAARRIEAAQARVAQAGIPVELLMTKIHEGRAKGVAEERIAAVAERRASGLLRAQDALAGSGRQIGPAEISAGADALGAGVDAHSLRQVIQQARQENTAVALAVLGELVKQGLSVEQARERVEHALQRGGDALASLPQQAAAARGAGRPASAGRPAGVGNPPAGTPAGPPAGVPAAGTRPEAGRPEGTPGGRPEGTPGGRPGGTPGRRP